VVQAWLEHGAAVQVHQLNERGVAAARAAVDSAAVQAANDVNAEPVLAAARGDQLRVMDEAIRSELAVATTRARLGELMGVSGWRDDWQVIARLPPVPDADPDPATLEAEAMQHRLDLLAAAKAVVEIPLFDQRRALLMQSDAELRAAMRRLESAQLAARTEIRIHVAELKAIRQQLQQFEREILTPARRQLAAEAGAGVDPAAPDRLRLRQTTLADEAAYIGVQREYWRTRSALALSVGEWTALSGL
jgi:hypothetical protein